MIHYTFTLVLLLATTLTSHAGLIINEYYSYNYGSTEGAIPDSGSKTFSEFLSTSQIAHLTEVQVCLSLSGNPVGTGWAGDMFVSLNRNLGTQTAVLLNQAGVTGSDPVGFGHDGWNVTFKDTAANGDIHLAQPAEPATILTGLWQPDGRLDPTDTARPAMLEVFNTTSANTFWHLTIADLSEGGTMTLNNWSITLSGFTAVPEPQEYVALAGLGLLAFAAWRKTRSNSAPQSPL